MGAGHDLVFNLRVLALDRALPAAPTTELMRRARERTGADGAQGQSVLRSFARRLATLLGPEEFVGANLVAANRAGYRGGFRTLAAGPRGRLLRHGFSAVFAATVFVGPAIPTVLVVLCALCVGALAAVQTRSRYRQAFLLLLCLSVGLGAGRFDAGDPVAWASGLASVALFLWFLISVRPRPERA